MPASVLTARPDLYLRYKASEEALVRLQTDCSLQHTKIRLCEKSRAQLLRRRENGLYINAANIAANIDRTEAVIAQYRADLEGIKVSRLAIEEEQAAVRREWRQWVASQAGTVDPGAGWD